MPIEHDLKRNGIGSLAELRKLPPRDERAAIESGGMPRALDSPVMPYARLEKLTSAAAIQIFLDE
jgi:hypothetical protein